MTKITIADAQINAAIARLNGWKQKGPVTWIHPDHQVAFVPPDYLHSWALTGPLPLPSGTSIYLYPTKIHISFLYIHNNSDKVRELRENTELRARCLAFLAMHYPDGEIPDETT